MIGKVRMMSRGPGGRVTKADASWIRAMRKERQSWALIATYFQPSPSIETLRRIAAVDRRAKAPPTERTA